ncbi:MAG: 3-deoxy-D-manno-octulosonic acid transferase, partial [Bacteroidia bacterium]
YAYMVIIGGGFGKSIHNILEPAAFGVPILFGPIHHKFKEAKDLLASGGAFEINNQNDFDNIVTRLYNVPETYKKSAHASRDFIETNIGGTEKVYIWLREKMLL